MAQNKSRRKYPEIPGLKSRQLHYRAFQEKHLQKDVILREMVVKHLGAKCIKCGYDSDIRALVLDHKRGDGSEDRKRVGCKVQRYYVKRLKEAEDNLQVLCANCNLIKSLENREHNKSRRISMKEIQFVIDSVNEKSETLKKMHH